MYVTLRPSSFAPRFFPVLSPEFSHIADFHLTISTTLVIACHSPTAIYLSKLRQAPPSRGTSLIASTIQSDCRCLILGVSLEVPFIESITLTELGPPPSLTMCLLCTKPTLNHLFCNDKKAESRQYPYNLHSRNAPCFQQDV